MWLMSSTGRIRIHVKHGSCYRVFQVRKDFGGGEHWRVESKPSALLLLTHFSSGRFLTLVAISDASGQSFSTSSKGPKKDLFWPMKLFLTKRENISVSHENGLQVLLEPTVFLSKAKHSYKAPHSTLWPRLLDGRGHRTNQLCFPSAMSFLWTHALSSRGYCSSTEICKILPPSSRWQHQGWTPDCHSHFHPELPQYSNCFPNSFISLPL